MHWWVTVVAVVFGTPHNSRFQTWASDDWTSSDEEIDSVLSSESSFSSVEVPRQLLRNVGRKTLFPEQPHRRRDISDPL